jgi:N6-adenosine-specific RNA methylase IME4
MVKVDNFMIDPPWQKKKGGLRKTRPNQGRLLDYKVMSTDDIFDLLDKDILPLANDRHNVFLWCVDQYLLDAEQRMLNRGYIRHARLIWDKGNGIAPAFTVRYSHEYLIWYYKPKLTPIAKNMRGKFKTVFQSPGRQHSRKPDEAYELVKLLYPDSTCLDVFSRESRKGWLQFGDELDYFN